MSRKPDFIFAGLPRTGSSWLFKRLFWHPDVFLPPCKEVDYFWGFPGIIKGQTDYGGYRRKNYIRNRLRYFRRRRNMLKWKLMLWDMRFLWGRQSPEWYSSLFREDKYCGDISPTYAVMRDEEIAKLVSWLPEVKVLIGLRDPVERAWSEVKQEVERYRNSIQPDELHNEYKKQFDRIFAYCPDFLELIERWERHVKPGNLLVVFYDDLKADHLRYLEKICEFLGIDVRKVPTPSVEKEGQSVRMELPESLESYMISRYSRCIERIFSQDRIAFPASWESKYRKHATE